MLLGTIAIVLLFGQRLLPHRSSRTIPPDLSKHARTLVEQYKLDDGVFQLRVRPRSPYVGAPRSAVDLASYPGLQLLAIQSGSEAGARRSAVAEGDMLIVRGDATTAGTLAADKLLAFRSEDAGSDVVDALFNRTSGLAEVVIPPRSDMVGQPVFPGMITPSGDLVVLAVHRRGEDQGPGETMLAAGDTLLLQGTWKALDEHLEDPDVLVVDSPDLVRRQAVPMGVGAWQVVAVLVAMVVLLATGIVPAAIAGLLAAGAVVLLGVLTIEQAYRSINWTTVILVGAMMPLSTAMSQTGAAKMIADGLVGLIGDAGPYALLAGLFVLTGHPRPADQQHGDRADRDPDRRGRGQRDRGVAAARVDERRRGRGRRLPHARRDAREPDGDGAGRVPLWRLLEAGVAPDALVPRGGDLPRAGVLVFLTAAQANRSDHR